MCPGTYVGVVNEALQRLVEARDEHGGAAAVDAVSEGVADSHSGRSLATELDKAGGIRVAGQRAVQRLDHVEAVGVLGEKAAELRTGAEDRKSRSPM